MKKIKFILCITLILVSTYVWADNPKEEVDKESTYSEGKSDQMNVTIEIEPDKKISLKYAIVHSAEASEVYDIVEFYKETINNLINMNDKQKNYNDRLHSYVVSLKDYEIYRFLYLDSFINSQYPEFYKEFVFINSDMKRAVSSGLFTENDIFNLSIYPHENIKPYFTGNIHPSNTLPTLLKVRNELWKRMIEERSELLLLNESFTFNNWAIVKFIRTEKISIENRVASPVMFSECVVIDSPNLKMIGRNLKLSTVMFGEDRDFFTDQNYLVNYGYSISPRPEKRLSQPTIIIDPQMKYVSQNNRIYSLTENNEINIYNSKSMYNSNYYPLEGTDITNANSLFEKIMELQNDLKERGVK